MRSGTTRLDHGLGGGEHRVSSCGEAGCSVHRVAYDAPIKQVAALAALSARCEQHVKVGNNRDRQPSVSRSILILILPKRTMGCGFNDALNFVQKLVFFVGVCIKITE